MKRASTLCPLPPELLPAAEWPFVLDSLLKKPEKSIRLRPPGALGCGELCDLPFETDAIDWYSEGRFTPGTHQPGRFLTHSAGLYFIQDAGSMLALALLAPKEDEWVADLCAAPGGKASAILEKIGPGPGFLLANEPIAGRVAALQWNLARTGYPRYAVTQMDVENLATPLDSAFDAILVDAPCTGQTLIGRGKHSLTGAFSNQAIAHATARQKRILRAAAKLARPGGRLVYSTCTLTAEENEEVVRDFLAEHAQWSIDEAPELEQWLSPLAPGGYRLWPHRNRCAGAYAVRLRRDGESDSLRTHIHLGNSPARELPEVVAESGTIRDSFVFRRGRQWFSWPSEVPDWLEHIPAVAQEIAFQPAKVFQPAHALALRRDGSWAAKENVELSTSEAQAYLQGQTLLAREPGWSTVSWQGHPLGWIHSNHLRANNSLPPAARLPYPPAIL